MNLSWLVCLTIILCLIGLFIASRHSNFRTSSTPALDLLSLQSTYSLPSLWENHGAESTCQVYSVVSTDYQTPANISLRSIQNCTNQGTCLVDPNAICADDDQLFATISSRTCRYGDLLVAPINEYAGCQLRSLSGTTRINGYFERYAGICTPTGTGGTTQVATAGSSSRCSGSAALVSLNFRPNSLAQTLCLRTPEFDRDAQGLAKLRSLEPTLSYCSLSDTLSTGDAAQILRVVRAVYLNAEFSPAQSGPWTNLVHRPTGWLLGPQNTGTVASIDFSQPVQLMTPKTLSSQGYWWYLASTSTGTLSAKSLADYLSVLTTEGRVDSETVQRAATWLRTYRTPLAYDGLVTALSAPNTGLTSDEIVRLKASLNNPKRDTYTYSQLLDCVTVAQLSSQSDQRIRQLLDVSTSVTYQLTGPPQLIFAPNPTLVSANPTLADWLSSSSLTLGAQSVNGRARCGRYAFNIAGSPSDLPKSADYPDVGYYAALVCFYYNRQRSLDATFQYFDYRLVAQINGSSDYNL